MTEINADFTKSFKGFTLNVSLSASGVHGLLGASGAGKSATLACISGIARPDNGIIKIGDKTVFSNRDKLDLPPRQRKAALIMQSPSLFKNLSARKNIELCVPKNAQADKADIANALIRTFKLEGCADKPSGIISGGQAQRAVFARALAAKPLCLLLDEPFSALDGILKDELCAEIFPLLLRQGVTVLYVTHDLSDALNACKSITVIENGITSAAQTVQGFLKKPNTKTGEALLKRMSKI